MKRGRRFAYAVWRSLGVFAVAASFFGAPHESTAQSPEPKKAAEKSSETVKEKDKNGSALSVVSESKRKEQQKGSEFLRPPGADRYSPGDDSGEDLPWRQAFFFGIKAKGQRFIYVVDCSGSMMDEARLARAKAEVRRSILALQLPQQFKVIFYNDRPISMPGDLPKSADMTAKGQLLAWLRLIEPDGETDPRGAIAQALALRPDAVFLLSDGEYPEGTVEAVARMNPRKVPIHCVDLSGGAAGDQLQQIARDSGGRYAPRPWRGE
jgi:hypothetical protein